MGNPLKDLEKFGQSPWFDSISRVMLTSGELEHLIEQDGLKGVTSNPTIFEKAISGSADYDGKIARAMADGVSDAKTIFERLAVDDIRDAADALQPVHARSHGGDGFVSLEVSPTLAYDARETVREARRLHAAVDRKNLMIKVPATRQGLAAISSLIGEGISVNVTLIFSNVRYGEVMDAYLNGLETLERSGRPLSSVASVASFFVSRIDSAVDKRLGGNTAYRDLLGKTAIANAKLAYEAFLKSFSSARFKALAQKGARVQRPLWASTSTKNLAYRDVVYVEELIGPDTINTIPPATWEAFRDHGRPRDSLREGIEQARQTLARLNDAGVDLDQVTAELEEAGVKAFADSFAALLRCIEQKLPALPKAA